MTLPNKAPRVRFAPSPTGKLHVGGARTAIYNWAFARATGGTFILRIDDTDPTRSTAENEAIILRAMRWLGLDWDEGPGVGGEYGPYKQMERMDIYRQAVDQLLSEGKAYRCFCTPEELEASRKAAADRKDSFQGYQRTCRNLSQEEVEARLAAGEPYVVRIAVPLDRGDVIVHDHLRGEVRFNARELDDFVIMRSDGTPTYNFCTVVDDALMGITHVIRGDDHLSNTPRQVMVYEALGYDVPEFAHISMILGADGKKLSKRHGATSVEEYRDGGFLADAFVNYLALLGWSLDGETTIFSRETLAQKFSLEHVSKNPSTFDPKKLDWMNEQYLQAMSDLEFAQTVLEPELVAAGLEAAGCVEARPEWFCLLAQILKPRTKHTGDVVDLARFLYTGDAPEIDPKAMTKALLKEGAAGYLEAARTALAGLATFEADAIDATLEATQVELGANKRTFFGAVRAAATGSMVSPPLGVSLELLGQDTTCARIDAALAKIAAAEASTEA